MHYGEYHKINFLPLFSFWALGLETMNKYHLFLFCPDRFLKSLSLFCFLFCPHFLTWSLKHQTCMLSHFSCVWLFVTPWTVAHQPPLSMGLSRQEYWNGLPCLPSEDLSNPRIKPITLMSPALRGVFFTISTLKHQRHILNIWIKEWTNEQPGSSSPHKS